VKIFVIEDLTSSERAGRRHFWEGWRDAHPGAIDIIICPQERWYGHLCNPDGTPYGLLGYDVVFIHERDKEFPWGNYVDLLRKDLRRPFVCYSNGYYTAKYEGLNQMRAEELPLIVMKSNISRFFSQIAKGGLTERAFFALAGLDSRREAAIALLERFLPLDLALQMLETDRCIEYAEDVAISKAEVTTLMAVAIDEGGSSEFPEENARVRRRRAQELLERLWAHSDRVRRANGVEDLLNVFGWAPAEGLSARRAETRERLAPDGFHCTYEKLRDSLLDGWPEAS